MSLSHAKAVSRYLIFIVALTRFPATNFPDQHLVLQAKQ
jgi:hypothetical protein